MRRIKQSPNIEYCGFVSETKKHDLLATCRALIFNGHSEDFGIVPIEANASDKAVLTRDEGFPGIFVQDGENGLLHDGTVPAIRAAIKRFEISGIDGAPLGYVQQFSRDNFDAELWSHLSEWCAQHRPSL
jgi:glycosyltransferase involved in cell wall biosynthesis